MRNDSAAEAAAEELRAAGAEPVLVRGNVASDRVVTEFASHGPYDVGRAQRGDRRHPSALETEDKHWDWTLNANARALLSLARACAPDMKDGSSIVAISCLGSQRVLENYVLVGTSKAALESVVRYLGVELAPRGIRVNAVSAGVVETEALDISRTASEMLRAARARLPDGWSSPRTSPAPSRSSAPPTRRWSADRRDRRRRLLAARLMEPTEHNRRAWDEIHRQRAEALSGERGLPLRSGARSQT